MTTREIKFRAWDREEKKWLELTDGGLGNLIDTALAFKEIELMQYTGLKDKNGKEIYEGDIVEIYEDINENEELDYVGEIVYYEDGFGVEIKENDGALYSVRQFTNSKYSSIKIIGNIAENPDQEK